MSHTALVSLQPPATLFATPKCIQGQGPHALHTKTAQRSLFKGPSRFVKASSPYLVSISMTKGSMACSRDTRTHTCMYDTRTRTHSACTVYARVCVCTHLVSTFYAHMYMPSHTHTHIHIRTHTHTCTHVHAITHIHIHTQTCGPAVTRRRGCMAGCGGRCTAIPCSSSACVGLRFRV